MARNQDSIQPLPTFEGEENNQEFTLQPHLPNTTFSPPRDEQSQTKETSQFPEGPNTQTDKSFSEAKSHEADKENT